LLAAGALEQRFATALDVPLKSATVTVEGDRDFCGTLGVSKKAPVGFSAINEKTP
jgi:hypothetical protein